MLLPLALRSIPSKYRSTDACHRLGNVFAVLDCVEQQAALFPRSSLS